MCSSIGSDCHQLALPELSIIREDGSGRVCPDNRCYTNTLSDGMPSSGETGEPSLCILFIICHILTLPSNFHVLHCYFRSVLRRSCIAMRGLGKVLHVHAMKVCGRNGCTAPLIPNLLDGGEWSASCPGHFRNGEITPGIHRIGAWVGPRTSLDTLK